MNEKISQKKNGKMAGKDWITCGIFSAISFIVLLVATVANITPYTMIFYPSTYALLNGVVFLLLNIKVPKKGSIMLFSAIVFIYNLFGGVESLLISASILVFGLLSELILLKNRKSFKRITLAYIIYTFYMSIGGSAGMFVAKDAYLDSAIARGINKDYVEVLRGFLNYGWWAAMIAATIITSILGMLIGKLILKKHLSKAGIL